MNVKKALLSLVRHNAGQFKSEKQANFLLSFFDNGQYVCTSSLHFGEYKGRTSRNTASVTWIFYADEKGITKVCKDTHSKGTVVHWENTPEYISMVENKNALSDLRKALQAKSTARRADLYKRDAILDRLNQDNLNLVLSKPVHEFSLDELNEINQRFLRITNLKNKISDCVGKTWSV